MTAKRLEKQIAELSAENFIVTKVTDTKWTITFRGPNNTPFEGGTFVVEITLNEFPFKAPVFIFKTPIYHPNVGQNGEVCKDMIGTDPWQPTKKICAACTKIMSMMVEPNLDTPLNQDAANDYKKGTWKQKAAEQTKKHAK